MKEDAGNAKYFEIKPHDETASLALAASSHCPLLVLRTCAAVPWRRVSACKSKLVPSAGQAGFWAEAHVKAQSACNTDGPMGD